MSEPAQPPIPDTQRAAIAIESIAKSANVLAQDLLSRPRLESYYLRNNPQIPNIIVESATNQDLNMRAVRFAVQSAGQILPGARPLENQQFNAVTLLQSIIASGTYNPGSLGKPEVSFSYPSGEQRTRPASLQFETDINTTFRILNETAGVLGLSRADLEQLLTKITRLPNIPSNIVHGLLERLRNPILTSNTDQLLDESHGREAIEQVASGFRTDSVIRTTLDAAKAKITGLIKGKEELTTDTTTQQDENIAATEQRIQELEESNTQLRDALDTRTNELEETRDLMEEAQGERNKAHQEINALKTERDRYKGESEANKRTAEANQRTAEANLRTLKTLNDALGREKKHAKEIKDVDSEALKQANARIKQLADEVKQLKDKYEPPPPPPPATGLKGIFNNLRRKTS